MRKFAVGLLMISLAVLTGCKKEVIVYPDSPWVGDPGVEVLAIAPFLVRPEIAMQLRQSFSSGSFTTSDGATVYFSPEFSTAFADGLTHFKGLKVVQPDRVVRAWIEAVERGEMTNPLANRDDALAIARRLNADAILVGEVLEWDPFNTRLTLDWSIHATRTSAIRAIDIRRVENSGKGGLLDRRNDRSAAPMYAEQLTLDREQAGTRKLLEHYSHSLADGDNKGYASLSESVANRPFPRFVRFAAWVAMMNAFKGTTSEAEKNEDTRTAGGE
jgi:hypothetical protein